MGVWCSSESFQQYFDQAIRCTWDSPPVDDCPTTTTSEPMISPDPQERPCTAVPHDTSKNGCDMPSSQNTYSIRQGDPAPLVVTRLGRVSKPNSSFFFTYWLLTRHTVFIIVGSPCYMLLVFISILHLKKKKKERKKKVRCRICVCCTYSYMYRSRTFGNEHGEGMETRKGGVGVRILFMSHNKSVHHKVIKQLICFVHIYWQKIKYRSHSNK